MLLKIRQIPTIANNSNCSLDSYRTENFKVLSLFLSRQTPYNTCRRVGIILLYLHFQKLRENRGQSFGRIGRKSKNLCAIKG